MELPKNFNSANAKRELNVICPHCFSVWCIDEIQEQECFTCGYPRIDCDIDWFETMPDDEREDLEL